MPLEKLTREEVARRGRSGNTVFIIDNVVYDVTKFLEHHPGGADPLLDNVGHDASVVFRDVGHSRDAWELMQTLAMGELADEDRAPEPTPVPEKVDAPGSWLPLLVIGIMALMYAIPFNW